MNFFENDLLIFLKIEKGRLEDFGMQPDVWKAHFLLGIILFGLMAFQHMGGVIIKYRFIGNKSGGPGLYTVKKFHMVNI